MKNPWLLSSSKNAVKKHTGCFWCSISPCDAAEELLRASLRRQKAPLTNWHVPCNHLQDLPTALLITQWYGLECPDISVQRPRGGKATSRWILYRAICFQKCQQI